MDSSKGGPLQGVRILDLTTVLSGPFATSWLCDMGAEVIKIENPHSGGDYSRQSGPYVNGESTYFATVNRSKRCITMNLKDPKATKMVLDLVRQVDVVTENFKPGTMDKLGLGFEVLREVNPCIVLASISGYGQCGPYKNRPGYDVVSQAMGAIMSITGCEDMPPMKCGPSIGDVTAGMNMVIGVLAALYRTKTKHEAEWVEVSLVDSVLALTTQDYIDYGHTKVLPKRLGNSYSLWCPYGAYPAKDRYFTIGVGTAKHWELFCRVILGRPELIDDPLFHDHPSRVANRRQTDQLVLDWCSGISAEEAVKALNEAGIPGALVYDFSDVESDTNFTRDRQMICHMQHPVIGDVAYINIPIRFRESGLSEPRPAGMLGQFNEEVYSELLGLSPEEIRELKAWGTI